jgi:NitT/TauT family transport system substrate-binding protein
MPTTRNRRPGRLRSAALVLVALLVVPACSSGSSESRTPGPATVLRLGYFPNVTHAAAVLAVRNGAFQQALTDTRLETATFDAGPEAIEALLSGAIDATFIGPNPAINAYVRSGGDALRIVAGATNNGASLVVAQDVNGPQDLKGRTLATPQFGGTQDVTLRKWLLDNGLRTMTTGGDDVDIINQRNAQTLTMFRSGLLAGAWLPEPWASRLVQEAGAKVLLDERILWPDQQFQTTVLIVARQYLVDHPQTVQALISGEVAEIEAIRADPGGSRDELNAALAELGGKPLPDATIRSAFESIAPTWDPLPGSLNTIAAHAHEVGMLSDLPDLTGIYDLAALNTVLAAQGQPPVSAAGLGTD